MNNSFTSFPSIFNFGHRAIASLLDGPVNVEEKVDGSQFSFGVFKETTVEHSGFNGQYIEHLELKIKSKGAMIYPDAPPKMFKNAVETVHRLFHENKLVPGWTYRGEVLDKPKHNALAYDRIPSGHIILFDINTNEEEYLSYEDKAQVAESIGLEVVPRLFTGRIYSVEHFRSYLTTISILGGQQIEGVVVKPVGYNIYGVDKKVLMGKFVSEAFREVHKRTWGESNPTQGDVVEKLIQELSTPARYAKAVIHLRERGLIEDDVKDIGKIIAEVRQDIAKEEKDYIGQKLYRHFADHIIRRAASGVPQWYKDFLLARQFEQEEGDPATGVPVELFQEALNMVTVRAGEEVWADLGRAPLFEDDELLEALFGTEVETYEPIKPTPENN